MNASIIGLLANIKKGGSGWRAMDHKGKRLSKSEVVRILEYGLNKGYKGIGEFTDEEVDEMLSMPHEKIEDIP